MNLSDNQLVDDPRRVLTMYLLAETVYRHDIIVDGERKSYATMLVGTELRDPNIEDDDGRRVIRLHHEASS